MTTQHFFFRLIPPRPNFADDMDDDEQELMRQHVTYVSEYFEEGTVLAYGPVQDPDGWFGIVLLEVLSHDEAIQFAENDPTVMAGLNRYSIAPMHIAAARGFRAG
ncbi:YciI family protein [Phyllobacterium zundukense]|uniref:YciI family protein n=1 Tax=Phyllobacterium zundukense TaxID=1867719 RepID=A0ACD4D1T5_9HYPH|nr:YciI family protein [Phyllobacterium zundukense]UXN59871.1 YciI family protein [Phyllobacterium zundukense]